MTVSAPLQLVRSLRDHLARIGVDGLMALIEARPDLVTDPRPVTRHQLALRVADRHSASTVVAQLPLPCLQAAEAARALGRPVDHGVAENEQDGLRVVEWTRVRALLGARSRQAADDVNRVLDQLANAGLAWPCPDHPAELVVLHPALATAFPTPLGLGPSITELATGLVPSVAARVIAAAGGVASGDPVTDRAAAACVLADPVRVAALVQSAPLAVKPVLDTLAATGHRYAPDPMHTPPRPAPTEAEQAEQWPYEYGLVVTPPNRHQPLRYSNARLTSWQPAMVRQVVPREVGLTLRGSGWTASFTPTPPVASVRLTAVEQRQRVAGTGIVAVSTISALVAECSSAPVPCRKTAVGGVGVTQVRRLAGLLDCPVERVGWWLELAVAAGLLRVAEPAHSRYERGAPARTVTITPRARVWERAEPAARWRCLLWAWQALEQFPLATDTPYDSEGDPPYPVAPLQERATMPQAPVARQVLLDAVAALPDGAGFDSATVAEALRWHCPRLFLDPAGDRVDRHHGRRLDADVAGPAVLAEADLLGITTDGVLSAVGRALDDGDPVALAELTETLLPAARRVRVQADHTVIAAGVPSVEVATLLDGCARLESAGFARTWRITAASVRGWLDTGQGTAADLLARLEAITEGTIPQAVAYLIGDVGRRHGHLRVHAGVSVVHAEDPALLAQVAADPAIAALGAQLLAPTVLVCRAEGGRLLEVLRTAGYAPVPDRAGPGAVVRVANMPVARDTDHAEKLLDVPTTVAAATVVVDSAWVAALLDSSSEESQFPLNEEAVQIRDHTPLLGAADREVLVHALSTGSAIVVEYDTGSGLSSATIRRPVVTGDRLIGHTTTGKPSRGYGHPLRDLRMVLPAPHRRRRATTGTS